MDEDDGSEMGDSHDVSSEENEVEEGGGGWDVDYDNAFGPEGPGELQEFEAEEDGTDRIEENDDDEGWTGDQIMRLEQAIDR